MPSTRLQRLIPVNGAATTGADLPWTGHLLRRTGFGATPDEVKHYAALGWEGAIDLLVNYEQVPEMEDPSPRIANFDPDKIQSLQQLWLLRMVETPRPLEEKMTLFWHNHFATSVRKVNRPAAMWNQNSLFRTHALGNFRQLVQAVAKDPAMMIFLDTQTSVKNRPNENFARELLELFTVGIGNYTETDIKESARAFTGWQLRNEKYFFNRAQFDATSKTYLGKTGAFTGEEIIDIAVSQPSTARFIVSKLYRTFIDDKPNAATIEKLANIFVENDTNIRPVVKAILLLPEFTTAYHASIKSPVDFVVGTVRSLDVPLESLPNLLPILRSLGQELFAPPNVKGWPEGVEWLSVSSLLNRANFTNTMLTSRGANKQPRLNPLALFGLDTKTEPEAVVDAVLDRLVDGDVSSAARRELIAYFTKGSEKAGRKGFDGKVRGLMHLVMALPSYQFN